MKKIDSPTSNYLPELCEKLADHAVQLDTSPENWPREQLQLCGEYGVFAWFLNEDRGGVGWTPNQIVDGYLALSSACLSTTFVITQRVGACRRIAGSANPYPREQILAELIAGDLFATVGISHLTTSHRHLDRPVLRAEKTAAGFRLDGFCPWVTGGRHADHVVVGATLEDGKQVLICLPMDITGVETPPAEPLLALNASQTGRVVLNRVEVDERWVLAGPIENVMAQGVGAATGGIQTSTLALGLAQSALDFLAEESASRDNLVPIESALRAEWDQILTNLRHYADGAPVCSTEELRSQSNSMVLRATQSAMAAAKGRGFVAGHPAGRWCREALFFLVWSCPQPVMQAQLCEFAGIQE